MLEIKNVHKAFGRKAVLRGVDLIVKSGSICGLLGLNGEGKSTLMKIICGLVRKDSGVIVIDGREIGEDEAPVGIGAMIEAPAFYGGLGGFENLELMRKLCDNVPPE